MECEVIYRSLTIEYPEPRGMEIIPVRVCKKHQAVDRVTSGDNLPDGAVSAEYVKTIVPRCDLANL